MIGDVTSYMLSHPSGVSHLHANRPLIWFCISLPSPGTSRTQLGLKGKKKWLATPRHWLGTRFQTFFSPINRINHYLVDKYWGNQFCYPLDKDLRNLINIALGILKMTIAWAFLHT